MTFDPSIAFIAVPLSIVVCSFLSGVVGGGGGTMLLGVLLVFVDVPTAMIVFAVAQGTGNITRVLALWRSIQWRIVISLFPGVFAAAALLAYLSIVPNKAFIYIALGAFPLASRYIPEQLLPRLNDRRGPPICGMILVTF